MHTIARDPRRALALLLFFATRNVVIRTPSCTLMVIGGLALATGSLGQTIRDVGTLGGMHSEPRALSNTGHITGWGRITGDTTIHAFHYADGTMTDLGTLGGISSIGFAINDSGQVAGHAEISTGHLRAFLYSNGRMIDLGTLGGNLSQALAINNTGQVTGWAQMAVSMAQRAFIYSNGTMTGLGTLGGNSSRGHAINNAGQVTGYAQTSAGHVHAFLYSNGTMTDLGTLGGVSSIGHAINDAGQVAGTAHTSDGQMHAFLYSNGTMTDLGSLGGDRIDVTAINGAGQVTGAADIVGDTARHAFLYSNGKMIDLGAPSGGRSDGRDINEAGQVVGMYGSQPYLYSAGRMYLLNIEYASLLSNGKVPGFTFLTEVFCINDAGQIAGRGLFFDGSTNSFRVFLLDTRPTRTEPPTAIAGPDQGIRAGETVTLDGRSSFDDNTPTEDLQFAWELVEKPEGSTATLTGANTSSPSFLADVVGSFVVALVVTDQDGLASEPSLVTISTDNLAPLANATVTPDLALIGEMLQLDGSASSDPEGDPMQFTWSLASAPAGSVAVVSNAHTAHATFVPDVGGTYEFALTVADALGAGAPANATAVATTGEGYTQIVVVETAAVVTELPPTVVTTAGNQQALTSMLGQVLAAVETGDTEEAINKLRKAIERTDGWVLRGRADENGPGRDWITDRDAQFEAYTALKAALDALTGG